MTRAADARAAAKSPPKTTGAVASAGVGSSAGGAGSPADKRTATGKRHHLPFCPPRPVPVYYKPPAPAVTHRAQQRFRDALRAADAETVLREYKQGADRSYFSDRQHHGILRPKTAPELSPTAATSADVFPEPSDHPAVKVVFDEIHGTSDDEAVPATSGPSTSTAAAAAADAGGAAPDNGGHLQPHQQQALPSLSRTVGGHERARRPRTAAATSGSRLPSSRIEAILLLEAYAKLKKSTGYSPSQPLDHFDQHRDVVESTFREATRQVVVHCEERGALLGQIWRDFVAMYDARYSEIERLIAGRIKDGKLLCDCHADKERALAAFRLSEAAFQERSRKLDAEMRALQARLEFLEKELEAERLMRQREQDQAQNLLASRTDRMLQLENILRAADDFCIPLRDRTLPSSQTGSSGALDSSRGRYLDDIGKWQASVAMLGQFVHDSLTKPAISDEELEAMVAARVEAQVEAIRKEKDEEMMSWRAAQVEKMRLEKMAAINTQPSWTLRVDKGCQADIEIVVEKKEKQIPKIVEVPSTWQLLYNSATKTKGQILSRKVLSRTIMQVYLEKMANDEADAKEFRPPRSMPEHLTNFFHSKYGVKAMVTKHLKSLLETVTSRRDESLRIRMFGSFAGLFDPLPLNSLSMFLELLGLIRFGSSRIFHDEAKGISAAPFHFASQAIAVLFGHLQSAELATVHKRLEKMALDSKTLMLREPGLKIPGSTSRVVDVDELGELVIDESRNEFAFTIPYLKNLFDAVNTQQAIQQVRNLDPTLDFQDFACLLRFVDPTVTPRQICDLFYEAVDEDDPNVAKDLEVDYKAYLRLARKRYFQTSFKRLPDLSDAGGAGGIEAAVYRYLGKKWPIVSGAANHEIKMLAQDTSEDAQDMLVRLRTRREMLGRLIDSREDHSLVFISFRILILETHLAKVWRTAGTSQALV